MGVQADREDGGCKIMRGQWSLEALRSTSTDSCDLLLKLLLCSEIPPDLWAVYLLPSLWDAAPLHIEQLLLSLCDMMALSQSLFVPQQELNLVSYY